MAKRYTPRRQSARWLDGDCPADVLCILDAGPRHFDRWTVFYRHVWKNSPGRGSSIFGRGMSDHPSSPQGVGCSIELEPYQVAALRAKDRSARWSDLPPAVQDTIRRDCMQGGLGSPLDDDGRDLRVAA